MQYATVTLTWEARAHPIAVFEETDEVTVEAIRHVSPGPAGRYVELLDLRGNPAKARAILDETPTVLEYAVSASPNGSVAYLQRRQVGLVRTLLETLHDHDVVLDWPAYPLSSGRGIRVTVVGTSEAIGDAAVSLPASVTLELERLGAYEPGTGHFGAELSDRQRALLELAVSEGYYAVPRETTHRELADHLGLATSTVSERLQRIEARLMAAAIDR